MRGVEIFCTAFVLCFCSGINLAEADRRRNPTRNDLRITGGVCQFPWEGGCLGLDTRGLRNPYLFQKLGRTVPELILKGWQPIFGRSLNCENDGKFNGFQWSDPRQPPSVFLLLDVQGIVAGMQFVVPYRDVLIPGNNYQYHKQPMIQNTTLHGLDLFYVTVYFMEPDLICSKGRSWTDLKNEGTISKFFVQNGPTPLHSKPLPLTRRAALSDGWDANNCFRGMGHHSFYRQSKWDSDRCTSFQPLVTFFDQNGDLNGLAFFIIGKASSHFFERPTLWLTEWIAGKDNSTEATPKCLAEVQNAFGISGIHVYLTERPYEFKCDSEHEQLIRKHPALRNNK